MLRKQKDLKNKRTRVARGVRKKISGTPEKPRLSVFRSNKQFYCQAIDDSQGRTLTSVSSLDPDVRGGLEGCRSERVKVLGKRLAERLKEMGVERAVFDRGWYRYHGCIKAFADSVREGGIRF